MTRREFTQAASLHDEVRDTICRAHGAARRVPFIIDAAYGLPFPGIQREHLDLLWNPNVVLCLSLSKLGLPAARSGELARLCRDHLRRLATANSPARRRVLPVAVVPGPADLKRSALPAAKQRDVLVLSGHHFFPGVEQDDPHQRECLRLSYAQPPESVRAGIAILAEEVRRAYERG